MKSSTHSTDWREYRRLRAWDLNQKGWKQRLIAEALGVSEQAVGQWINTARKDGVDHLSIRKSPGRHPKLSSSELKSLEEKLSQGARQYGYPNDLWDTHRVRHIIHKYFGVQYNRY